LHIISSQPSGKSNDTVFKRNRKEKINYFRDTFIGAAFIGSAFVWWDLTCYALGSFIGWLLMRGISWTMSSKKELYFCKLKRRLELNFSL
jgi:hypothetical protein